MWHLSHTNVRPFSQRSFCNSPVMCGGREGWERRRLPDDATHPVRMGGGGGTRRRRHEGWGQGCCKGARGHYMRSPASLSGRAGVLTRGEGEAPPYRHPAAAHLPPRRVLRNNLRLDCLLIHHATPSLPHRSQRSALPFPRHGQSPAWYEYVFSKGETIVTPPSWPRPCLGLRQQRRHAGSGALRAC
jgi:hypothetical protein